MEMFSKELEILDKNTVQYMIDEMQNELDEKDKKIDSMESLIAEKDKQIQKMMEQMEVLRKSNK